jgi:hypothetical protein
MCDSRDLGAAIGERPPAPNSGTVPDSVVGARYIQPPAVAPQSDPSAATLVNDDAFTPTRRQDVAGAHAKEFFEPNLYLYDAYPGGIGFSEPLFRVHDLLVRQTRELISTCPCDQGCPSCVGPAGDLAPQAKAAALAILDRLCH